MRKKFPLHPAHPERTCWGCDKYCAANAMMCGNGSDRTQHPSELWGDDWPAWVPGFEVELRKEAPAEAPPETPSEEALPAAPSAP